MLKLLLLLLKVFPNSYFLNQLTIRAIFLNPCAGDPATIGKLIGLSIRQELTRLLGKDTGIGPVQHLQDVSEKS